MIHGLLRLVRMTGNETGYCSYQTTNEGSSSGAFRATAMACTRAGLLDSGRAQELPDSAMIKADDSAVGTLADKI